MCYNTSIAWFNNALPKDAQNDNGHSEGYQGDYMTDSVTNPHRQVESAL